MRVLRGQSECQEPISELLLGVPFVKPTRAWCAPDGITGGEYRADFHHPLVVRGLRAGFLQRWEDLKCLRQGYLRRTSKPPLEGELVNWLCASGPEEGAGE